MGKATKRNAANSGSPPPHSKSHRWSPQSVVLPTPEKSNSDKKCYRLIRLDNGLRCLLISDKSRNKNPLWAQQTYNFQTMRLKNTGCCPSLACEIEEFKISAVKREEWAEGIYKHPLPLQDCNMASTVKGEDKAAFCLIVQAGGANDPQDCQGLAHFAEHMLHYGSKKYPGEGKYWNFIQSFGNDINAYTQLHSTAYACSIHPNFLMTALDIFANMVTYPTFDANCAEREVNSVDSEFYLRKNNPISQIFDIIKFTLREGHPLKSFTCGNASTLKKNLRDHLQKFHKEHYVANKMTFAIQSSAELDFLQKLVEESLGSIPSGKEVDKVNSEDLNPYNTNDFSKLYQIKGQPSLCMVWKFPPEIWKNFDAKPLEVLNAIMTDGREGSLKHYLHQKGWIYKFDCDSNKSDDFQSRYATLYFLIFALTPSGTANVHQVVQAVFTYIETIIKAPLERKQNLWEELRHAAEAYFDHIGDGTPHHNTHFGARSLVNSPTGEDMFTTQLLFQEKFDNEVFCRVIKSIKVEETLFIQHVSELRGKTTLLPYTNFPFTVSEIPKEFKNRASINLRFPSDNKFITNRFEIEDYTEPYKVETPKLVLQHIAIRGLTIPKACVQIHLISTEGCKSLIERYMLSMLCNNIAIAMSGDASCAYRAGLVSIVRNQTFNSDFSIVSFAAIGFSEFMPELVQSFCRGFSSQNNQDIQRNVFEQLKSAEINYYNETLNSTNNLLMSLYESVMVGDHINEIDSLLTPNDITKDDFEKFVGRFRASMVIQAEIDGNISRKSVKYIESLLDKIEYEAFGEMSMNIPVVPSLPEGESAVRIRRKPCEDYADANNAVLNLYQLPVSGKRDHTIARIVTNLMRGRVFQKLRTEEQLGYSLGSGGPADGSFPITFYIVIETPCCKYTPCYVNGRIDNFLTAFYNEHLSQMTEKAYRDTLDKMHLEGMTYISLEEVQLWYQQYISSCVPSKANGDKFIGLKKLSFQVVSSAKKGCTARNCNCLICRNSVWVQGDNPRLEFARVNIKPKEKVPTNYFISSISEYHDEAFR